MFTIGVGKISFHGQEIPCHLSVECNTEIFCANLPDFNVLSATGYDASAQTAALLLNVSLNQAFKQFSHHHILIHNSILSAKSSLPP